MALDRAGVLFPAQPKTVVSIGTVWRTVRYLRAEQVWARARRLVPRRSTPTGPPLPLRKRSGTHDRPIYRAGPIRREDAFCFLNRMRRVERAEDWNHPADAALWRYNLHYFDWLRETAAIGRHHDDQAWIERWIADNPVGVGTGWDPYPLSLRLVNWIVWLNTIGAPSPAMIHSLSVQARHLERSLEYHILGNHLFVNAKALIFAGALFAGNEAERWLTTGIRILSREIEEQILGDGGHFELSPMYHGLILEDVADVLGLTRAYPELASKVADDLDLVGAATRMAGWLFNLRHPDGEIPYFNDAAFGIAPVPGELLAYAERHGVKASPADEASPVILQPTGFAVLSKPPLFCVFDGGRVCPDYLPGHAHADTLSFELSIGRSRLISNSGSSTYASGAERAWERSTAAHATVEIDGANSAEVWAAFRTGRRPNVSKFESGGGKSAHWVECQHDGYRFLPGSPVHRRRLTLAARDLRIDDTIEGGGVHAARGLFPLHPGTTPERTGDRSFRLATPGGRRIEVRFDGQVDAEITPGRFAMGFGATTARPVIEWRWRGRLPVSVQTHFRVIA